MKSDKIIQIRDTKQVGIIRVRSLFIRVTVVGDIPLSAISVQCTASLSTNYIPVILMSSWIAHVKRKLSEVEFTTPNLLILPLMVAGSPIRCTRKMCSLREIKL